MGSQSNTKKVTIFERLSTATNSLTHMFLLVPCGSDIVGKFTDCRASILVLTFLVRASFQTWRKSLDLREVTSVGEFSILSWRVERWTAPVSRDTLWTAAWPLTSLIPGKMSPNMPRNVLQNIPQKRLRGRKNVVHLSAQTYTTMSFLKHSYFENIQFQCILNMC